MQLHGLKSSMSDSVENHVLAELAPSGVGLITLNRPQALNALSLPMVHALTRALRAWQNDPAVKAVAIRGMGKAGQGFAPFGTFCAGGDIRFFYQAALAGDKALDAFFTAEYALDHLVHHYGKPCIALMDGIVMGGGMGIGQGASLRVVTENTRMAMPETRIGFFPDAGGGYFLSRTPGHIGEWLGLTGHVLNGNEAVLVGLADACARAADLPRIWQHLAETDWVDGMAAQHWVAAQCAPGSAEHAYALNMQDQIDHVFGQPTVERIWQALEQADTDWARHALKELRLCSPLMLHVALEQIRRARYMSLADALRMERGLAHQCFYLQPAAASETVEGIRALVIDKDHQPRWQVARVEDIRPEMVVPFFANLWPASEHPLSEL